MIKENKNPDNTGKKLEDLAGKPFQKGDDPRRNLKGRPKGSVSIITVVKQILQEKAKTTDGTEKERLETLARNIVHMAINNQDKDMIKLLVNYIDGMPKQNLGLGFGEEITGVNITISKEDANRLDSKQKHNEDIHKESGGMETKRE